MPIFFGENLESPLTDAASNWISEGIWDLPTGYSTLEPLLTEAEKLAAPDRLWIRLYCASRLLHHDQGDNQPAGQRLLESVLAEVPQLSQEFRPELYNFCAMLYNDDLDDPESAIAIMERDDNLIEGWYVSDVYRAITRRCFEQGDYERMLRYAKEIAYSEEFFDEFIPRLVYRGELDTAARLAALFPPHSQDQFMLPYERLLTTLKETGQQDQILETITKLRALGIEVNWR
ncbi:hypothetical protein [Armatimonas sp.]|uniref:hypothetical protein n=1 Tax=Armatimonas sp. TaxID=1872638 RepID=UPI00374CD3E1